MSDTSVESPGRAKRATGSKMAADASSVDPIELDGDVLEYFINKDRKERKLCDKGNEINTEKSALDFIPDTETEKCDALVNQERNRTMSLNQKADEMGCFPTEDDDSSDELTIDLSDQLTRDEIETKSSEDSVIEREENDEKLIKNTTTNPGDFQQSCTPLEKSRDNMDEEAELQCGPPPLLPLSELNVTPSPTKHGDRLATSFPKTQDATESLVPEATGSSRRGNSLRPPHDKGIDRGQNTNLIRRSSVGADEERDKASAGLHSELLNTSQKRLSVDVSRFNWLEAKIRGQERFLKSTREPRTLSPNKGVSSCMSTEKNYPIYCAAGLVNANLNECIDSNFVRTNAGNQFSRKRRPDDSSIITFKPGSTEIIQDRLNNLGKDKLPAHSIIKINKNQSKVKMAFPEEISKLNSFFDTVENFTFDETDGNSSSSGCDLLQSDLDAKEAMIGNPRLNVDECHQIIIRRRLAEIDRDTVFKSKKSVSCPYKQQRDALAAPDISCEGLSEVMDTTCKGEPSSMRLLDEQAAPEKQASPGASLQEQPLDLSCASSPKFPDKDEELVEADSSPPTDVGVHLTGETQLVANAEEEELNDDVSEERIRISSVKPTTSSRTEEDCILVSVKPAIRKTRMCHPRSIRCEPAMLNAAGITESQAPLVSVQILANPGARAEYSAVYNHRNEQIGYSRKSVTTDNNLSPQLHDFPNVSPTQNFNRYHGMPDDKFSAIRALQRASSSETGKFKQRSFGANPSHEYSMKLKSMQARYKPNSAHSAASSNFPESPLGVNGHFVDGNTSGLYGGSTSPLSSAARSKVQSCRDASPSECPPQLGNYLSPTSSYLEAGYWPNSDSFAGQNSLSYRERLSSLARKEQANDGAIMCQGGSRIWGGANGSQKSISAVFPNIKSMETPSDPYSDRFRPRIGPETAYSVYHEYCRRKAMADLFTGGQRAEINPSAVSSPSYIPSMYSFHDASADADPARGYVRSNLNSTHLY